MKKILIGSLVLIALLNSCAKNSVSDDCNSAFDPCAVKVPQSEIDSVRAYLVGVQGITDTVEHCSGLFYKIDSAGSGVAANICSTITIAYKGRLKNGTVFDQSDGLTSVLWKFIAGMKIGLPLIKTGGTIHLYVPPSLAYGNQAVTGPGVNIPPNSILIFDVTLLQVQ